MFPGTSTGIILASLVVKFVEESFLNPRMPLDLHARSPMVVRHLETFTAKASER